MDSGHEYDGKILHMVWLSCSIKKSLGVAELDDSIFMMLRVINCIAMMIGWQWQGLIADMSWVVLVALLLEVPTCINLNQF